ncbi:MAG: hypothetical protein C0606_03825 [Hyphomicrobiales bacterium]|nr:MAG: hypothetical protein C0606_03825 [Hyphomicrobiales bacterium]
MKRALRAGLIAFVLSGLAGTAAAQERILTPERAAGFDAVVTQCVSFVRIKSANAMCDKLARSVAKLAEVNGLAHSHLGRTEWGFGTDEYLKLPADAGYANPVHLTFYIRATGRPNSVVVWCSLYQRIDDAGASGRTGRLVIWEDSGIGAGPAKKITAALAAGIAEKLEPVFETLGEGRAE